MHRLNLPYGQFCIDLKEIWLYERDPNTPVHVASLVESSGNTSYKVESISSLQEHIQDEFDHEHYNPLHVRLSVLKYLQQVSISFYWYPKIWSAPLVPVVIARYKTSNSNILIEILTICHITNVYTISRKYSVALETW